MSVDDSEPIQHRNGGFDDYCVSGNLYSGQNGETFWTITVVSDSSKGLNQTCRVVGNAFECFETGTTFPKLGVRIGNPSNLSPEVKQRILALLRGWELEASVTK